ncbi:MAG TPA: hypothetical protein VMD30_12550 [Tepidisphaeraceae bacterium]|nr:hypothetical protein [Tepidisphaeraceae bacterium]
MSGRCNSIAWAALVAALCGCATSAPDPVQSAAPVATAAATTAAADVTVQVSQTPGIDPPPVTSPDTIPPDTNVVAETLEVARLDVYQFDVPQGAVSQSDAFWKHVEEPVVDVATNNLLYNNGVRAGEGIVSDWPYFEKILDKAGGERPDHSTLMAQSAQSQEVLVGPSIPEQRLFFFDRHGLSGKVYEDCRDLVMMSYEPAPRDPGCVRVALCPVVQATQYHYTYDAMNAEQGIQLTRAEHLYDLNLTVDLPAGKFLVIAPSPDAGAPDSVGARFLTQEGAAVREERVLIVVADKPATLKPMSLSPVP